MSLQANFPLAIHLRNKSTFAAGQAPSQGIRPSARALRILSAWSQTSWYLDKSNARFMALTSLSRKRCLMSAAKLILATSLIFDRSLNLGHVHRRGRIDTPYDYREVHERR